MNAQLVEHIGIAASARGDQLTPQAHFMYCILCQLHHRVLRESWKPVKERSFSLLHCRRTWQLPFESCLPSACSASPALHPGSSAPRPIFPQVQGRCLWQCPRDFADVCRGAWTELCPKVSARWPRLRSVLRLPPSSALAAWAALPKTL